jgi:RHS repeat-associated protein
MKLTFSRFLTQAIKSVPASRLRDCHRQFHGKGLRLFLFSCALIATISAQAQNVQFTQGGVGSGLDNTMSIPLMSYPGRGTASLPINLHYSSRVWRINYLNTVYAPYPARRSVTEAIYAEHSRAGWTSSLDVPKVEWPKPNDVYWQDGKPYHNGTFIGYTYRVARVFIHMPDGSAHEFRRGNDQVYIDNGYVDKNGTFYAVDGSRMRYDSTNNGETGELFLPDGAHYRFEGSTVKYIDRNGNTLIYNTVERQWKDTLGRDIKLPFPTSMVPQNFEYTVRGVGDTPIKYIFKWRTLSETLTPGSPAQKSLADYYLPNPGGAPTQQGGANFPQATQGASLFASGLADEENGNSYTYVVGQGQLGSQPFNPVVLAEIELPNGQSYKFSYNIYGEIDRVTYPSGGYQRYQYDEVPGLGQKSFPYTQASRGVTLRAINATDISANESRWMYETTGSMVKTTAPDGTYTKTFRHNYLLSPEGKNFGYEDERNGLAYDEQVYAPNNVMLRRTLTEWVQSGLTYPTPATSAKTYTAKRNARPVKTVSLILDTGGDALAKTLTYQYDTTYEFTTGVDQTVSTESHFDSVYQQTAQTGTINEISPGSGTTLASSVETAYVDSSDPNYYTYRSRNILGLVRSVTLKDGNNQPVGKTMTFYDQTSYAVNIAGQAIGWTDPATSARGNATTSRRYVSLNSEMYLESHVSYDQWGNVRSTWDARGNQSQVDYLDSFGDGVSRNTYAYATSAMTAVPDPSGAHGSNAPFTSSCVFDYTTGLMLSTTDANGQTTTFSYIDPNTGAADALNRLRKVTRPDGSWTRYSFNDVVGNHYTLTETQVDATKVTIARQYFDKLGRSVRSFAYENSDPQAQWMVSDTYYDLMGRVSKVSNAYRTASPGATLPSVCSLCTTSLYDALGRVTQVSLPDGTSVQTAYQGIYTTVTDQAGKQRRQKTDALGRIVRVDEPNASGELGSVNNPAQATIYNYDTQGNLIHIQQGAGANIQHRYFKYDALGRLTYERQVEQGAIFTMTDPLTNNSQWTRRIVYDENGYQGLPTTMTDARNIQTQYQYDNLNRVYQISYGDSTPTLTNLYDQARPGYLNKGRLTEVNTAMVAATMQTPEIPTTSQVYDYDVMGRITRQKQTMGGNKYGLTYAYNAGGQLVSETYPSGRVVNYSYDEAARLNGVTSGATTYASNFQYGAKGVLASLSLGNGSTQTFAYNDRLQPSSMALTKDGTTLQRYDYKYGKVNTDGTVDETKNNGQIGRIEGYSGANKQWQQRFSYDSIGRLSQASEYRGDNNQQSYLINYNYDQFGNRYQYAANNPLSTNPLPYTAVEDSNISKATNRLTFSQITYDAAGNITIDSKFRGRQFQYDANNRQKYVALTDGTAGVWSVYDGTGQRVATITNGNVSTVMVYDAMGKLVAEYGTATAGGTQYVFADHQGSTRVVTNQTGAVISRQDYEPFGGELGAIGMRSVDPTYGGGNSVRQKYAEMEQDDGSGMSHTLWRKYDRISGRWTSPDPYGGSMSVSDPQSFNRYTYVNNDPVNLIDPLGLMLSDIGVVQTDDPEYAWTLQRNKDMEFQRTVNYDSARRRGLDVKEEPGGFGSHFTIQQQDFQTLMPNPKPGEVWFDGYFDEGGVLTWWFGVPYSLTEEFAGTSVDDSLPDETPKTEGPNNSSHIVCVWVLCGGFTKNSNGKVLLNIGASWGPPRISYTHSRGKGYQGNNLNISASAWWPFDGPGTTIVNANLNIGSGGNGFSTSVSDGTPQAGIQVMLTLDLPPGAYPSGAGLTLLPKLFR